MFNNSVNEFVNDVFTIDEICIAIKKLKNNKSCGYDNFTIEFLNNCPQNVISLIVKIINVV